MLLDKSILELASLIKNREISITDLVKESLRQIEMLDGKVNAFISVRKSEDLLAEALLKDKSIEAHKSPLYGIPFSVKDSYVTESMITTAGSNILKTYQPPYTATVIKKLIDAGAILLGKNNQDSWGHGGSNENSDFGSVKNPWDLERIAGGSSGGSAAAVSSRMVTFSIGEDTGGSIRNPSALCSVSGLKVSYGRVSRYGTIAYASSLDTVGPIAKSSEDIAHILGVIAGVDLKDASSSMRPVTDYSHSLHKPIDGVKIGIPKQFFSDNYSSEVKELVLDAVEKFKSMGCTTVNLDMPLLQHSIPIYYMLAASETSSNLARFDGIRYGNDRSNFLPESKRRIILGTYALSAGYADKLYKNAQRARTLLIESYQGVFKKCDVIIAPTTPNTAQKLGELINNPMENMLSDVFTTSANIVGVPSISVPIGFSKNELPVGMQIIGNVFEEADILNLADAYQSETDWHTKTPKILGSEND